MATEASYYGLYLLKYLKDTEDLRQHNHDFINSRADDAAGAFEGERRSGAIVDQAQEVAMRVLIDGFSPCVFWACGECLCRPCQ